MYPGFHFLNMSPILHTIARNKDKRYEYIKKDKEEERSEGCMAGLKHCNIRRKSIEGGAKTKTEF
jgi:hypothetical protein